MHLNCLKAKTCFGKKVLNFSIIKKNSSASSKNALENRNYLVKDTKLQNECLKTYRPSGFTPKECVKIKLYAKCKKI